MNKNQRILLCVTILLLDLAVFFLPLSAVFLVYVIWHNPPWFRQFLQQLDRQNPCGFLDSCRLCGHDLIWEKIAQGSAGG